MLREQPPPSPRAFGPPQPSCCRPGGPGGRLSSPPPRQGRQPFRAARPATPLARQTRISRPPGQSPCPCSIPIRTSEIGAQSWIRHAPPLAPPPRHPRSRSPCRRFSRSARCAASASRWHSARATSSATRAAQPPASSNP
eukprot:1725007-Alexandrium_andersonii.AAC.1